MYSGTAGAISWTRPATPGLTYEIVRDGTVLTTTDGTSYVDEALSAGRSYLYEVIAIGRDGRRSAASTVTLETSGGTVAALELREDFHDESVEETLAAIARVSGYYEASTPAERPYAESVERAQTEGCLSGNTGPAIAVDIDIDAAGEGSYSDTFFCDDFGDRTRVERVGIRTVADGAVSWSGTYERFNSSSAVFDDIAFETRTISIGSLSRQQAGTFDRAFRTGSYGAAQTVTYRLVGTRSGDGGGEFCAPTSGTITNEQTSAYVGTTTISREPGDPSWTVRVSRDGQPLDAYRVDTLGVDYRFHCDFEELDDTF